MSWFRKTPRRVGFGDAATPPHKATRRGAAQVPDSGSPDTLPPMMPQSVAQRGFGKIFRLAITFFVLVFLFNAVRVLFG